MHNNKVTSTPRSGRRCILARVGATDLGVAGKPKNVKEVIEAGNTIMGAIGKRSGKINKSGMQRDHTNTKVVTPKPIVKPKQKPDQGS